MSNASGFPVRNYGATGSEPACLRSTLLNAAGVPHAFTTRRRLNGRPFDAGRTDAQSRAELLSLLGLPDTAALHRVRQVHGAEVLGAHPRPDLGLDANGRIAMERPADGLVSEVPRAAVMVVTADCVPVLLACEGGRRVGAVHAGWRGLIAGVIPAALQAMGISPETGGGQAVAAIGPCLSLAHFEVGEEVAGAFEAAGFEAAVHRTSTARPHVDLARVARLQLERGGVGRVEHLECCTWSESENFYSYRRDVTRGGALSTGRLGALVAPADTRS